MMIEVLSPGFILIIGALFVALTRGSLQAACILLLPLLTLWQIWQIPDGVSASFSFLGYTIEPIEGGAFRRIFATAFAIAVFVGALFAFRQARTQELAAAFVYSGAAIGAAFAGDLITLFVFWELMAVGSTLIIWCGGTESSRKAGIRYAVMHLLGGVILMVGIASIAIQTGSVDITAMHATDFGTWMILIGILINTAAPPVSSWLADAYPESSSTGAVFLSAFTTKTAVLMLILLFPGEPVLIGIGLYMVFYGIIYALLENDARRILAYSIINQVGFMVCAVGIGTEMALNGAASHAFAHIVYKALLFMAAGAVLYRTGMRRCTDLGGLFRTMPFTCICGIIGALAISSFPLTSGFTTKTMISEAAVSQGLVAVYFLLAAASAGVFLHAGIKFPWFVFFNRDSGLRPKEAPWNMMAAMIIFSAICIILGIFPEMLYAQLPYNVEFEAYKLGKVLFYLQLLLFSGLAFFLLLPMMKRTLTLTLDFDWFWRRPFLGYILKIIDKLADSAKLLLLVFVSPLNRAWHQAEGLLGYNRRLSSSWSIGTTATWIAGLLTTYILIYYV